MEVNMELAPIAGIRSSALVGVRRVGAESPMNFVPEATARIDEHPDPSGRQYSSRGLEDEENDATDEETRDAGYEFAGDDVQVHLSCFA
jgi:hypothetical protein